MEMGPKLLRPNDKGDGSDSVAADNIFSFQRTTKRFLKANGIKMWARSSSLGEADGEEENGKQVN